MGVVHGSLFGGYLGVKKTEDRIPTNFFWPGLHEDVTSFCRSCSPLSRKKFTLCLILLSLLQLRLAATGSFPFSRYRYRLIVSDYWVAKHFVFVYFFR